MPITSLMSTLRGFGFVKQASGGSLSTLVASGSVFGVSLRSWSSGGFGTAHANPAVMATNVTSVEFDETSSTLFAATSTSPYVHAYNISTSSGFGTKYANPGTLPTSTAYSIAYGPNGGFPAVYLSHSAIPYMSAYSWSSGFGTKFTNAVSSPGSASRVITIGENSQLILGTTSSPYVAAYGGSVFSFGTRYPNPTTNPGSDVRGASFSPDGEYIVLAHTSYPYVSAYFFVGGFGAKTANPALDSEVSGAGNGVAFHPAGTSVAITHTGQNASLYPGITVYPWSYMGFGTKFSNPGGTNLSYRSLDFTQGGDSIALSSGTSPNVSAYRWTTVGFGTKHTNPLASADGEIGSTTIKFNM
jgi:hypothetical protein